MSRHFLTPLLLALVLVGTIGCDRVTKRLATAALAGAPDRDFLAGTVRVAYAENTGGFLSVGAGWPEHGRTAVFVVGTGLLLLAVAAAIARAGLDRWGLLGATLFFAGGASNWIDRVVHGRVVDFLNLGVGPLRTGIFNVADVAIVAGLALLVIAHFAHGASSEA
jgi:signal peptidase II